jgi:hypothetical protein
VVDDASIIVGGQFANLRNIALQIWLIGELREATESGISRSQTPHSLNAHLLCLASGRIISLGAVLLYLVIEKHT